MNDRQAHAALWERVEKRKAAFDAAFRLWLDVHPEASEQAKQNERIRLWRKWQMLDDYETTDKFRGAW